MTVVKIYREPENTGLILNEEELNEYKKLAGELGLDEFKPDKVPSVYTPINQVQIRALKALCPCTYKLKKYTRGTIPVEALQAVKFATDNEMFDVLEVWCDDKEPDPVIIGKSFTNQSDRENDYTWNMHHTLIARWGDCSHELSELVDMAKERVKREYTEKAIVLKEKINSFLEHSDVFTNKFLEEGVINFEK